MKTQDAVKYFAAGTPRHARTRIANALGITPYAVHQWGEWVPELQALRLRMLTQGKLEISPDAPYADRYLIA